MIYQIDDFCTVQILRQCFPKHSKRNWRQKRETVNGNDQIYIYIYRKSSPARLPGIENHFLMNVPEVSEQQLSKHDWQDDRGIQRATEIDVETERDGTALFTPYWVRTLKTVHGTSRCVSIIATFILSFPRHGILSFAYIRYVMATLKRGIVQVARVCCTTVCPPSARWIADDGYQEGQDGCF